MPNRLKRRLTRRLPINLALAVLALFFPTRAALADPIAIWNFNDSDLAVDHGAGTLVSNFNVTNIGFAAGTTNNARLGDPAGQALSLQGGTSNANNGRNVTVNLSTVGYANIIVSFATQGTATGFNSNQFQYSLDGVTFVDFGSPYTPPAAFGTVPVVFNLTSIPGLNNNPNAAFRIVFNGATSATGTNRIDNLVVDGSSTTIPEPATLALLGSGLTTLFGLGQKRRAARK
jgi:PEP-CTERM motif-containing protein